MKIKGKVHMFGDNIDTDVIIPAQYCITTDRNLFARYCMNDIRNNFYNSVDKGDILVAGENFGCGSSREAAPIAILGCGISCIVAKSFSRIFYRNAVNLGLLVVENRDIQQQVVDEDLLTIDFDTNVIYKDGMVIAHMEKNNYHIITDIVEQKGLINYLISKKYI